MVKIQNNSPAHSSPRQHDEASIVASTPAQSTGLTARNDTDARGNTLSGLPPRAGRLPDDGTSPRKRQRLAVFEAGTTPAMQPTQAKQFANATTPAKFLVDHLKSQDLADMLGELNAQFSGKWAFGGSVALNIHAADLKVDIARPFHDADIFINRDRHQSFIEEQKMGTRACAFLKPGAESGDRSHFKYKGTLVDFIPTGSYRKKLDDQIVWISGIPVRSLKYLIDAKTHDQSDSLEPELAAKATVDLAILKNLQKRQIERAALDATPTQNAAVAVGSQTPAVARRVLRFGEPT